MHLAMPPHLLSASATHNLCMISADYSLAPQTRLPGILADLASLMAFVRSLAFKSATGGCADASKIVVSGGSAGGWLALLVGTGVGFEVCGIEVPEKPLGVCAIYPISALKDPFWSMVQRRESCLESLRSWSDGSCAAVSFFPRVIGKSELEEFLDPSTAVTTDSPVGGPQGLFYHYMVRLLDLLLSSQLISVLRRSKSASSPFSRLGAESDGFAGESSLLSSSTAPESTSKLSALHLHSLRARSPLLPPSSSTERASSTPLPRFLPSLRTLAASQLTTNLQHRRQNSDPAIHRRRQRARSQLVGGRVRGARRVGPPVRLCGGRGDGGDVRIYQAGLCVAWGAGEYSR